ncbi:DUF3990 domain-containing protein [Arabiibacter massiliensis]|uniref:DUF3990 domain-containing protein n=1 Tax=Arabiibacter massiliensis TaxID=1870985 RepID=UPI0009BA9AA8|nr:DUF3990 domain-containing protein [Arabiibacter massiliensis]
MSLSDGMTLYHGSYAPVEDIDLKKCSTGKDFGKGFYLTSDEDQARRFIRTSLLKAQSLGQVDAGQRSGYVSAFRFRTPATSLSVFEFPTADEHWLRFVSLNRRSALAVKLRDKVDPGLTCADVIIGKVANDTTNPVITTYLNGLYGPLDDPKSASTAIGLLLPDRLKDQFCFATQRAVACLEPMKVTRYEL